MNSHLAIHEVVQDSGELLADLSRQLNNVIAHNIEISRHIDDCNAAGISPKAFLDILAINTRTLESLTAAFNNIAAGNDAVIDAWQQEKAIAAAL